MADLNNLIKATLRSKEQTEFLLNLCGSFEKLQSLEWVLYNNSVLHNYVPQTIEDVERIFKLEKPKSIRVEWPFFKRMTN